MHSKRKLVTSIIMALMLIVGVLSPALQLDAYAKTATKNVNVGGVVFKFPKKYKSFDSLSFGSLKVYVDESSYDENAMKMNMIFTMAVKTSKKNLNFKSLDDESLAQLANANTGSAISAQDIKISSVRKTKAAGYQAVIMDVSGKSSDVPVTERMLLVANTKQKKLVMVIAAETNGDGSSLSVIDSMVKTAKKKKK